MRFDDELAVDSVEDLTTIFDDEEYKTLGMPSEDAEAISKAQARELGATVLSNRSASERDIDRILREVFGGTRGAGLRGNRRR